MLKSDFTFDLPEELIAQKPAVPRDAARLMLLGRNTGTIAHHSFHDLPELLRPGDLLVINTSRVLPARLLGSRQPGGGAGELLLLRQLEADLWECLARPGKKLRPGSKMLFGDGTLTATIREDYDEGRKLVSFQYNTATLMEKLDQFGRMPLPPYIKSQLSCNDDYQTVYARQPGSAAAPTAGLHFTPELMERLRNRGIGFAEVTLHVGLGTFRPVQRDVIEEHEMHSEWYSIGPEAAQTINNTKRNGGRVIAVGTTSCRTLEAVVSEYGEVRPASGETDIFLYPGCSFRAIDGLITNFHLPESTLIMLVSAFYGREATLHAYETAIQQGYKFFSFGDGMMII